MALLKTTTIAASLLFLTGCEPCDWLMTECDDDDDSGLYEDCQEDGGAPCDTGERAS